MCVCVCWCQTAPLICILSLSRWVSSGAGRCGLHACKKIPRTHLPIYPITIFTHFALTQRWRIGHIGIEDTHRFDRANSHRFMRFDNPSRTLPLSTSPWTMFAARGIRVLACRLHTHTACADEYGVKPVAFKVNLPIGFGLYVSWQST